ncbi:hypothetical protein BB8028_0007g01100 [Beauveria bassiana]|uniref:Uncharacterized protein n=1 Tax=Beauveria bassiana TaxID=176275 RepID=A0A2S7YL47_BEABA|nr:hypothetical protein BB8028_0007g01100 [Beauveria bassiana]
MDGLLLCPERTCQYRQFTPTAFRIHCDHSSGVKMSKNSFAQIDPKLTDEPESYVPDGQVQDHSSYVTRAKEPVSVQGDDVAVEEPVSESKANSRAQLERDENEAIDESNMVKGTTRGAKPRTGSYKE